MKESFLIVHATYAVVSKFSNLGGEQVTAIKVSGSGYLISRYRGGESDPTLVCKDFSVDLKSTAGATEIDDLELFNSVWPKNGPYTGLQKFFDSLCRSVIGQRGAIHLVGCEEVDVEDFQITLNAWTAFELSESTGTW